MPQPSRKQEKSSCLSLQVKLLRELYRIRMKPLDKMPQLGLDALFVLVDRCLGHVLVEDSALGAPVCVVRRKNQPIGLFHPVFFLAHMQRDGRTEMVSD